MEIELKPCRCGYDGNLAGMDHGGLYLSLSCPNCDRSVKAFTMDGLVENWNAPPQPQPDPCPNCPAGVICKRPTCGRLPTWRGDP